MTEAEEIRKAVLAIIKDSIPKNCTWAKVKSITGQSCTITIDELDIENIFLGFDLSGVIVYPVLNTDVLVVFIDNSKTNGAVIYVQETEKIEIMGKEFGGLAIVEKLKEQYNKIEQDLNSLKQLFITWVPVTQDGGAALKSASATWAAQLLIETLKNDIENDKVSHGHG